MTERASATGRRLLAILIAGVLLLSVTVPPVGVAVAEDDGGTDATPVPAGYYGTVVDTDGNPVTDAQVTAILEANTEEYGPIGTDSNGEFGGPSAADPKLTVGPEEFPADNENEVTFYVNGTEATTDQPIEWESGASEEVTLTVDAAEFDVSVDTTNSPITEGENLNVEVTVDNIGEVSDTQTIELQDADGNVVDTQTVTLNGGASISRTLTWDTDGGDAGATDITVASDDDTATQPIEIQERDPANFEVTIANTNSPITEGESLSADVTVDNTGEESATQTIALEDFDGNEVDTQTVQLAGGESESITLTWNTEVGDAETAAISARSDDDTDTQQVQIEEDLSPADFAVTIDDTNGPVTEGESLNVDVTVDNTGEQSDSQTITLQDFDGNEVDAQTVQLAGGESESITLTWNTEVGDAGTADIAASSDDDTATRQVQIEELAPANFEVEISNTSSPITEGENLSVSLTVNNTGEQSAAQTVVLQDFDGNEVDAQTVQLAGGESESITLTWNTEVGDAGTGTISAESGNDTDTQEVEIQEELDPANFEVAINNTNSPVTAGTTLEVEAIINNTGEQSATQSIALREFGGEEVDTTTISLPAGESEAVTLTWDTQTADIGSDDITVASVNDTETEEVEVQPRPANFDVTIDNTTSPVIEGDDLAVNITIANTGGEAGTQSVELQDSDGNILDTQEVSLDADEDTTRTLTWSTEVGDAGTENLTVASQNDSDTATVELRTQPATFDVTIDGTTSPVTAGEDLVVNVTVDNTGGEAATQAITLTEFTGESVAEQNVAVAAGATESLTLTWETDTAAIGTGEISVASEDDEATETVTVADPEAAIFEVRITDAPETVEQGENVTIGYEVNNTGAATATQDIEIRIAGEQVATNDSVELDPGDGFTESVTYTTDADDAPSINATVKSDDDSATATIAVETPPFFETTITAVNDTVERGETVAVEYSVSNTGDIAGTQDIEFRVDGEREATDERVTLGSGETLNDTFTYTTDTDDVPAIDVAVASVNDTATETVDVTAPEFELAVADSLSDDSVVAGSTADIAVDIENVGTASGNETVTLFVEGNETASETVPLDAGEIETVEFAVPTDTADAGETLTLSVNGTGQTVTTPLTVEEPPADPFFEVAITDANSSVAAGGAATVTANVTNVGELPGSQDVELVVRGTVRDVETVELEAGETRTVELTHDTSDRDTPAISPSVETANETVTESVEVLTPGTFDLSVVETNAPITAGENLTATVEIENVGDFEKEDTVTAVVNTTNQTRELGSEVITVPPGETQTDQFTIETDTAASGPALIEAESDDDDATRQITIGEAAEFAVEISEPEPVEAGTETTLNATVTNTGDATDTQRVQLLVAEDVVASERLELTGGETVTLSGTTTPAVAGDVTVEALTADAETEAPLTVLEPATFDLNATASESVLINERLSITVDVTNTGEVTGAETVRLQQGGETVDTATVEAIAPGTTETLTLVYTPDATDRGTQSLQIVGTETAVDQVVTVEAAGEFDVTIDRVTDPAVTGETLTAVATVSNVGDRETTESITLRVAGEEVETTDVTLGGREETTVQLTHDLTAEPGAVDVTVSGDTASSTRTIDVLPQPEDPFFRVTEFDAPTTTFVDENVTLEATIENVGDLEGTQSVALQTGGTGETSEAVTLAPGETATVNTTLTDLEPGELTASAVTANQTDTVAIEIVERQPARLEINAVDAPATAESGTNATVSVNITNSGDKAADRRPVTVTYAGASVTEPVSIAGGDTESVAIEVPIEQEPRAGDFDRTLTINTGNESVTRDLTVDFGSIQSGVDAATPGETVRVAPTDYRESVTVQTPNITIAASGADLTPRFSTGVEIRQSGVSVVGLNIDGNGATTGITTVGDQTTLDGVTITETQTAVVLDGSTGATIRRVDISDARRGVLVADAQNATLRVSDIREVQTGIEVDSDDLTIRATTITGAEQAVTLEPNVENADIRRNDIINNELGLLLRGGVGAGHQVAESNLEQNEVSLRSAPAGTQAGTADVGTENSAALVGEDNWWGDAAGPGEFDVRDNANNIEIVGGSDEPYTTASFEVTSLEAPTAITEGEELTVNATINNTGDFAGADTIALEVGDNAVVTNEIGLDGDENTTVTFTYTPDADDAGETALTVVTEDDTETQPLTVRLREATVKFADQATNSSTITTSETTAPGVVIENVSATVESTLVVTAESDGADEIVGLENLSAAELDGSDQLLRIASGTPGGFTAHVIPDENLSNTTAVGEPISDATATAALASANATVYESRISFDDQTTEGRITDGDELATIEQATLRDAAGGETPFVVYLHPTDADGELVADEFVGSSAVLTGSNENVRITADRVPADGTDNEFPISETDELVAMVHLVDDDRTAGDTASPGEFPVLPHADADTGFVSGGVSDIGTVTVLQPATPRLSGLAVTSEGPNATIEEGVDANVTANLTNVGEVEGNFEVTLNITNGETVTSTESVTLGPAADQGVTFTNVTNDLAAGDYTVKMSAGNATVSGALTVEADGPVSIGGGGSAATDSDPAFFEVSSLNLADVTVERGDTIDVTTTVTNTGEQATEQTIEFRVGDTVIAEESVVLGSGGGEQTITFDDIDTSDLGPGTYTHGVFTGDDSETGTLTVDPVEDPEAIFEVSDLDPADVTVEQGDTISVTATITNTGEASGTQTVEFRVGGETIAEESIELDAGGDQTVEFTNISTGELEGEFEHGVFTETDSQTGTLTVTAMEPDSANESEDTGETEDWTPGFGVVITVIALLAAALLVTRREQS